jgi:hypothetical protein
MEKKNFGLIILLICLSCEKEKSLLNANPQSKVEYFKSENNAVLLQKKGDQVTVFCNPINIGKYGCSLSFGGILNDKSFTKGYFLENSTHKNTVFDTIVSNSASNVSFKLEGNTIITLCKTPQVGCEIIFNNSMNYNKNDTLKLQKINKDIVGIAIPINVGKIKNKEKNNIDTNNLPVIVLRDLKDSLEIVYRKQYSNDTKTWIKDEEGVIAKKDYKILK